ncbi:MAG: hypothetical protein VB111_04030 [Clostridiaceae bacterium]|nr:hypothetical protein [Clostridiaceae bacterium]
MKAVDIYLIVFGSCLILWVLTSYIRLPIFVSTRLLSILERRHKTKQYLVHQRINLTLLGVVLITAGFLSEALKLPIALPTLLLIFFSTLFCNKRCLNHWSGYGATR